MENIYTDESLVRPPYGCKPGLNRRILTKWYRQHWEIHGQRITSTSSVQAQTDYDKYVQWAKEKNLPILPLGQYPSDEQVEEYVTMVASHMTSEVEKP